MSLHLSQNNNQIIEKSAVAAHKALRIRRLRVPHEGKDPTPGEKP